MNTPVTGGNVSLYNEIRLPNGEIQPIQPTPVIGMVGLIDDLSKTCSLGWKFSGDLIWLLGLPLNNTQSDKRLTLGASSYLEYIHGQVTGRPPEIDLELEEQVQSFLRMSINKEYISSAHDISDGGIAVALSECCISSNLGAHIDIGQSISRIDQTLFAEGGARILVSVSPDKLDTWTSALHEVKSNSNNLFSAHKLGIVTSEPQLLIQKMSSEIINIPISTLKDTYTNSIPSRINKLKK